MTRLDDHAEKYTKIHDYLLANGQQELAGHLDGIWQTAGQLQQETDAQFPPADEPLDEGETPEESARISAQEFQNNTKPADSSDGKS